MNKDYISKIASDKCPYCDGEMVNLYNEYGKITNRRCSNYETCPGHNAAKAELMFKTLGVQGIGYKTCLDYLMSNNLKSHLDCLPLSPVKELYLYDVLRLLCIDGIDKQFKKECEINNIYTMDDINKLSPKLLFMVQNRLSDIDIILKYITLKQPTVKYSDRHFNIMITGPVIGFSNKNDFIEYCNAKYGNVIKTIHQESKRKTEVDYLIKEPQSAIRAKAALAKANNIPIVTSKEYINILEEASKCS